MAVMTQLIALGLLGMISATGNVKLDFGKVGENETPGWIRLGKPDGGDGSYLGTFEIGGRTASISVNGYSHTRSNYAEIASGPYASLSNVLRSSFLRNAKATGITVAIRNLKPSAVYKIKTYHHSTSNSRGGAEFTLRYKTYAIKNLKQSPDDDNVLTEEEDVAADQGGSIEFTMQKSQVNNAHMDLNAMEITETGSYDQRPLCSRNSAQCRGFELKCDGQYQCTNFLNEKQSRDAGYNSYVEGTHTCDNIRRESDVYWMDGANNDWRYNWGFRIASMCFPGSNEIYFYGSGRLNERMGFDMNVRMICCSFKKQRGGAGRDDFTKICCKGWVKGNGPVDYSTDHFGNFIQLLNAGAAYAQAAADAATAAAASGK